MNSVFLLQPNPDDTYFLAHVRGSGIYRISGRARQRALAHLLHRRPDDGHVGDARTGL